MPTLLLRLAAPLQSWGVDSKFEIRRTHREPTKSGVVGLLAAALGLRRDDEKGLNRLNQLSFGVRIDQEGSLLTDYHIARSLKTTYVTYRDYLADAIFLAGMESEDQHLLIELEEALQYPAFPLFLGRRSCPPTLPLCLGIRETDLTNALQMEPWQGTGKQKQKIDKLQILLDAGSSTELGVVFQKDLALSFNPIHRQYGYRRVQGIDVAIPKALEAYETKHDSFLELE